METQFGIVAMLDALGVSNYKIDESNQFVLQRDALLTELMNLNTDLSTGFDTRSSGSLPKYPKMTLATFGDTIIICWPTGKDKGPSVMFPGIAVWLGNAVALGIKYGILLRGAVSVGEYLADGSTILGPAVADAHAWSGEADWFGVVLTPHCQIYLATLLDNVVMKNETKINTDSWSFEYEVPLHQRKKKMYVINWPFYFWILNQNGNTGFVNLSQLLSPHSIRKGVESKYENSIEFFKWCEENKFPSLIKDLRIPPYHSG
ncbi:MAG: hypothetical protein WC626_08280 [Methanoregula sp.]